MEKTTMSSNALVNVKTSEEFILGDIEKLVDEQNHPWFKRAHVGKYLDLPQIYKSVEKLDECEMCTRNDFEPTQSTTLVNHKGQPSDIFLSLTGVLYVIVNSRKDRGKELKHHILTDIIPRGFNNKIKELQENHHLAIEEKDAALALLNDDLTEAQEHSKQLELNNTGLQGEITTYQAQLQVAHIENIDLIENRHVPRSGDIDTVLIAIEKNADTNEHDRARPFSKYMLRCQRKQRSARLAVLRTKYPNMLVLEPECGDANAVHCWNRFKQGVLTKENYFRNHFNVPEDARELFEDMFDIPL